MDVSTFNGKFVVVEMELVTDADGVLKELAGSLLEVTGRLDTGFFVAVTEFAVDIVFLCAIGGCVIFSIGSFWM